MVKKKKFSIEYAARRLKKYLAELKCSKHLSVSYDREKRCLYIDIAGHVIIRYDRKEVYVSMPHRFARLEYKLPKSYYGYRVYPRDELASDPIF